MDHWRSLPDAMDLELANGPKSQRSRRNADGVSRRRATTIQSVSSTPVPTLNVNKRW